MDRRRALMMVHDGGRDFQEVQWIKGTGYVDTGVKGGFSISLSAAFNGVSQQVAAIFGSQNDGSPYYATYIRRDAPYIKFGAFSSGQTNILTFDSQKHSYVADCYKDYKKCSVDGSQKVASVISSDYTPFSIYLFGMNGGGAPASDGAFGGTIYGHVTFWSDRSHTDVLMELVPGYTVQDLEIGYRDEISGLFLPAVGNFTKGADVN